MIKRIAITGPECTGKSSMAKQLAEHFQTVWVPEYSRQYLEGLDRKYIESDILEIAKGQAENEVQLLAKANQLIFADTEMIVNKIWSLDKFGRVHSWIEEQINNHQYDLYLLMDIDLEWEEDPLREDPDRREYLLSLYVKELEEHNLNYTIISGQGETRLENGIKAIENN